MTLAQGRYWRASRTKADDAVALEFIKGTLPEDLADLRDVRMEVPLEKWNLVVKKVHSDRKLLGGLLLDFTKRKPEQVSAVVGNDGLLIELRRVVMDATAVLVEQEVLRIVPAEKSEE